MNLAAGFDAHARNCPATPALTLASVAAPLELDSAFKKTSLEQHTYQELTELSGRCVSLLQRLLAGHDRQRASVAWAGGNASALAALYLACARLGVALVLLEPTWTKTMAAAARELLQPTLTLDESRLQHALAAEAAVNSVATGQGDSRFLVGFTSGSSGTPKAFVRSQKSWLATFRAAQSEFRAEPGQVVLAPGPLSHGLSFYAMAETLHAGGHFMGLQRFDAATVLHLLRAESVHTLVVVPTMLAALLETMPTSAQRASAGSCPEPDSALALKRIVTAGAKLTPQLRRRVQQRFPTTLISEYYGASELSFVTVAHAAENPPAQSVGRAFAGVELQVRAADGTSVATGQAGVVWVRSSMLADGMINSSGEVTPLTDTDGWATVGDVGQLDAAGFLTLVDRASNMIISGGLNVYPAEVESILRQHPGLHEVVVLGVLDDYWGERVCAVCQFAVSDPAVVNELKQRCVEQLAPHQRPARYYEVQSWPWTASTKIDRSALRRAIGEQSDTLVLLS